MSMSMQRIAIPALRWTLGLFLIRESYGHEFP